MIMQRRTHKRWAWALLSFWVVSTSLAATHFCTAEFDKHSKAYLDNQKVAQSSAIRLNAGSKPEPESSLYHCPSLPDEDTGYSNPAGYADCDLGPALADFRCIGVTTVSTAYGARYPQSAPPPQIPQYLAVHRLLI